MSQQNQSIAPVKEITEAITAEFSDPALNSLNCGRMGPRARYQAVEFACGIVNVHSGSPEAMFLAGAALRLSDLLMLGYSVEPSASSRRVVAWDWIQKELGRLAALPEVVGRDHLSALVGAIAKRRKLGGNANLLTLDFWEERREQEGADLRRSSCAWLGELEKARPGSAASFPDGLLNCREP